MNFSSYNNVSLYVTWHYWCLELDINLMHQIVKVSYFRTRQFLQTKKKTNLNPSAFYKPYICNQKKMAINIYLTNIAILYVYYCERLYGILQSSNCNTLYGWTRIHRTTHNSDRHKLRFIYESKHVLKMDTQISIHHVHVLLLFDYRILSDKAISRKLYPFFD